MPNGGAVALHLRSPRAHCRGTPRRRIETAIGAAVAVRQPGSVMPYRSTKTADLAPRPRPAKADANRGACTGCSRPTQGKSTFPLWPGRQVRLCCGVFRTPIFYRHHGPVRAKGCWTRAIDEVLESRGPGDGVREGVCELKALGLFSVPALSFIGFEGGFSLYTGGIEHERASPMLPITTGS